MALLEVSDLRVSFRTPDGIVEAVRGLSFDVDAGQTLGIVGESGSGKSVSTQTIMGLTRGARGQRQALFEGQDLLTMRSQDLQQIRGAKVGMIFQDPLSSLHPYYKVGWQIVEMIRLHDAPCRRPGPGPRAVDLLRLVGIPQPDRRVDDYPAPVLRRYAAARHDRDGDGAESRAAHRRRAHHGARRHRAGPGTAGHEALQDEFGTAIIMITHDLGVIADVADEVIVMYAGAVMERADRRTIFFANHHPYTEGLLESLPAYSGDRERLRPIPGQPPSLINLPSGCPFHPRCPYVMDRCRTDVPSLDPVGGDPAHLSACWLPHDVSARNARRKQVIGHALPRPAEQGTARPRPSRRRPKRQGASHEQRICGQRPGRR